VSRGRASTGGALAFLALQLGAPLGPVAAASEPTPQEMAAAEALFTEAKALMAQRRYAEACPKLAESQRLDPGGGTLLTLALCHEGEGKTASAWAEYQEALTVALRDGRQDRESVARQHVAALEPRLSRLSVQVSPTVSALGEAEVLVDGVVLGRAAWGSALPVDPGAHHVEVRAPAKLPWRAAVTVRAAADHQEVTVPALDDARALAAPPREEPRSTGWRTLGWGATGAGVAALAASGYLAVRAISNHREAARRCPRSPCSDAAAVTLNDRAKSQADWAGVAGLVGLGATAAGAYFLLTSSGSEGKLAWSPLLGRGELGASVIWRP
jgi:hypothetical protein